MKKCEAITQEGHTIEAVLQQLAQLTSVKSTLLDKTVYKTVYLPLTKNLQISTLYKRGTPKQDYETPGSYNDLK